MIEQQDNNDKKRLIKNSFGTVVVKGMSILIQLFAIPQYIRYFDGPALNGIWITMLSIVIWIQMLDMGIGQGLRNCLPEAIAEKNAEKIKGYISSAYFGVFGIVIVLLLFWLLLASRIDFNQFLGVDEKIIETIYLQTGISVFFAGVIIQLYSNIIFYILLALQKPAWGSFLNVITNLIVVLSAYGGTTLTPGQKMLRICIIYAFAANIPYIIATFIIFQRILKSYIPSIKYLSKEYLRQVVSTGGIILWLQIVGVVINRSNEIFVLKIVSAEAVVEYQIYYKIFGIISSFVVVAMQPVWSAVTKADAEGNIMWIKKLNNFCTIICIAATLGELLIVPFMQVAVDIWLGKGYMTINYGAAMAIAVSNAVFVWHYANTSVSNGMQKYKLQMIVMTFGAAIDIPLCYVGAKVFGGWVGIVIANVIILIPYEILQYFSSRAIIRKKLFV